MGTIKIGDTVNWRGAWGAQQAQAAIITDIELCEAPRMKYGKPVKSVAVEDKDRCIFSLSNGHWAYGTQVSTIN